MSKYMIIVDGYSDSVENNKVLMDVEKKYPSFFTYLDKCHIGNFNNFYPDHPVDSLNCIMTLLGAQEDDIPSGRSYLEALACGIDIKEDDIVFRCNITEWCEDKLHSSTCTRFTHNEKMWYYIELLSRITLPNVDIYHIGDYKGIVIIHGMSKSISEVITYPPHENLGVCYSQLIHNHNDINHILSTIISNNIELPDANKLRIIPWGESIKTRLPSFKSIHKKNAVLICGTEIVNGIGKGMDISVVTGKWATGDTDTDLRKKAEFAVKLRNEYDVVIVHVNGADEAAHRRSFSEKTAFLQLVEEKLVIPIINTMEGKDRLLICSDHGTNSETSSHIRENQPFVLYSPVGVDKGYNKEYKGIYAMDILLENL